MNIIHLPRPNELAYNLEKLPSTPEEYAASMKSLAASVIDYSKQIEQLFGMQENSEDVTEDVEDERNELE